jgi:hypothetical protein
VWVLLPFEAGASSCGLALEMSVGIANPQLVPLSRLPPSDVIVPEQSWPAGALAFATSVLRSRVVPLLLEMPPPARPEELAVIVT